MLLARYLTAAQVHRLAFAGKHGSVAYRRLLKLCRTNGQPAFVRQRFFRRYDGERLSVWAPTPYAMHAALTRCAHLPELPKHDVGAQFLEHLIQLNELLIDLWSDGGRCPKAAHPSFRWIPSDRVRLTWGEYEMRQGREQQRVIQPDAVLELPHQRRRYFLECEMGTQMISPGEGDAPGATLSKADRYRRFLVHFPGRDNQQTHYSIEYPDQFTPEVLFLVLTPGRASSVNAALASWREKLDGRKPTMRAVTFDSAALELRKIAGIAGHPGGVRSQPGNPVGAQRFPDQIERRQTVIATGARSPAPGVPAPAENEAEERLRPGRVAVRGEQLISLEATLKEMMAAYSSAKTKLEQAQVSIPPLKRDPTSLLRVFDTYSQRAKMALTAYQLTEAK